MEFDINKQPHILQTLAEKMGAETVQMMGLFQKLNLEDKKLAIAILEAMRKADKYKMEGNHNE